MRSVYKIFLAVFGIVFLFSILLFAQENKETLSCAKEGETIGASGMPSSCCSGLKPVGGFPGGYNGDCSALSPPTGLQICSNCGDHKCDTYNGENKCNCPEDCK